MGWWSDSWADQTGTDQLGADHGQDFLGFGKAPLGVFGKGHLSIDFDIKDSPRADDQLRFNSKFLCDFSRQTGGSRLVVSLAAVGDFDLHGFRLQDPCVRKK